MVAQIENLGLLGAPLLLLSLVGLGLIIERILFFIRLPKIDNCQVLANMRKIIKENSQQPKSIRDEIATYLLLQAKQSHDFGIKLLRIIAVVSPMFGLLGTVIGIIHSFKTISLHDGPVYPALIADGLWTAMLTTAAGLIIALPCLIFAFIFARISEKRFINYQNILNNDSLKIQGAKL